MAGRAAFSSKVGFVMAAVGSAVGLGNLWRFPYLASTNGGATFLLLYLVLLFLVGIPALLAELSLGRGTGRSSLDAFSEDGKRPRWKAAGVLAVLSAALLLSYYSVIAGWSVRYMAEALISFREPPAFLDDPDGFFGGIAQGPAAIGTHLVFMAVVLFIVARGVAGGIERSNLIMMPFLFLAVIGLVVYANLLPGSGAGRDFYLRPDFGEITGTSISNAAGQTFFSIGLGIGTMLTYSSYLDKRTDLQRTGLTVALADTGVAFLAGLMVFPLAFSFGLSDLVLGTGDSSVGGLFIVVPTAFGELGPTLATVLSAGFFIMLTFAALSSAISLLEVGVSVLVDRFPSWGRARSVLVLGLPIYIVGLFSAIDLRFLDYADALVSRVLLITGGLLVTLYVGWVRRPLLDELEVGLGGFSMMPYFRPVIRYVLPVILGVLMLLGIVSFLVYIGVLDPAEGSFLREITTG